MSGNHTPVDYNESDVCPKFTPCTIHTYSILAHSSFFVHSYDGHGILFLSARMHAFSFLKAATCPSRREAPEQDPSSISISVPDVGFSTVFLIMCRQEHLTSYIFKTNCYFKKKSWRDKAYVPGALKTLRIQILWKIFTSKGPTCIECFIFGLRWDGHSKDLWCSSAA